LHVRAGDFGGCHDVTGEPEVIEEILPAGTAWAEEFGDPPDIRLFPEEEQLIGAAVEKRRREFATGRGCARRALGALGLGPVAIGRGARGAPRWPPGVVGSITHCAGYRAAAAARMRDARALGVDAEPDQPLPALVLGGITLPGERVMLRELAGVPGASWDRLLFSAKESVYKAWFPLTGRWLGFQDAQLTVNPADGTFQARLLVADAPLAGFGGRWLARDGLILTTVCVPAADF
jgi:4'-phosphopantetheinyl transferase EntD